MKTIALTAALAVALLLAALAAVQPAAAGYIAPDQSWAQQSFCTRSC